MLKKGFWVVCIICVLLFGISYGGNIYTYYSMPEGIDTNGTRIEYGVECPDGSIGTCEATPKFDNPFFGVDVKYY